MDIFGWDNGDKLWPTGSDFLSGLAQTWVWVAKKRKNIRLEHWETNGTKPWDGLSNFGILNFPMLWFIEWLEFTNPLAQFPKVTLTEPHISYTNSW